MRSGPFCVLILDLLYGLLNIQNCVLEAFWFGGWGGGLGSLCVGAVAPTGPLPPLLSLEAGLPTEARLLSSTLLWEEWAGTRSPRPLGAALAVFRLEMVAVPPVPLSSLAAALFFFLLSPEGLPGPRGPAAEEVGQVASQATVEGIARALAEVGNAV